MLPDKMVYATYMHIPRDALNQDPEADAASHSKAKSGVSRAKTVLTAWWRDDVTIPGIETICPVHRHKYTIIRISWIRRDNGIVN